MIWIYEENRIYMLDEKGHVICEANLEKKDTRTVIINRIYVDPAYRNQGWADRTMHTVMEYIRKHQFNVIPVCPYAKAWMEKKNL